MNLFIIIYLILTNLQINYEVRKWDLSNFESILEAGWWKFKVLCFIWN